MTSALRLLLLGPVLMLPSCMGTTVQPIASTPILTPLSTTAQTHTSAIDPLCDSIHIVELSRQDTTGTKQQVEANNAVLTKVCGDH